MDVIGEEGAQAEQMEVLSCMHLPLAGNSGQIHLSKNIGKGHLTTCCAHF